MYLERTEQAFVHAHHSSCIVEFPAIIGCTEQSDQLSLRKELVSVLDDLMSTTDQIHVVLLQETRHNVGSESERDSTVVFAPSSDVFVGVRPEKITEQSTIGNLFSIC